ncbi:MAG: ankyrin repeat domain-containing protein, partial [Gammaproteobacteria bacterium]|nr:ankyrin repeat domain-containing protein [Gammaproteobacteria bacterium]
VQKGADINQKNGAGKTPLAIAAIRGHLRTVNHLLGHGADIRIQDKNENNIFHHLVEAVRQPNDQHKTLIDQWKTHTEQLNQKNNRGLTPLLLALESNKGFWIEPLVFAGAEAYHNAFYAERDPEGNPIRHRSLLELIQQTKSQLWNKLKRCIAVHQTIAPRTTISVSVAPAEPRARAAPASTQHTTPIFQGLSGVMENNGTSEFSLDVTVTLPTASQ